MATNTAGSKARVHHENLVHYIAKTVTYADNGRSVEIGTLPSGAVVIPGMSGVAVNVVFNGNSSNVIDIGISGSTQKYASAMALGTLGWIELDVLTEAAGSRMDTTAEETILAGVTSTASATTGSATVIIAYVIPDR